MSQWNSGEFYSNPKNWQVVSTDDMQPGDILCYDGHVEIYAGNNRVYGCGWDGAIQDIGTDDLPETTTLHAPPIIKVLRVQAN